MEKKNRKRHFTHKVKTVNKHMKKCPAWVVIRENSNENIIIFSNICSNILLHIPIRMMKI